MPRSHVPVRVCSQAHPWWNRRCLPGTSLFEAPPCRTADFDEQEADLPPSGVSQWMITIGLLIAAVIVNATKDFSGASCYRIPIGLQFIWAASE